MTTGHRSILVLPSLLLLSCDATGPLTSELSQSLVSTEHKRCGWIGNGDTVGEQSFAANASFFHAIHPYWYRLDTASGSIWTSTRADNPTVVNAAAANGVELWPMVAGPADAAVTRNMFNNSSNRAAHINNLVTLAVSHGYVGLDLDYEHLWQSSDRPGFATFIQEVSTAMHNAGKKVSIAVPAMTFPNGAWDYNVDSQHLDVLHMMGYDYHWSGGPHVGPVAPLGWVDACMDHAVSTGRASKFILGVPNYGISSGGPYCTGFSCPSLCPGGNYATTTLEMESCPNNQGTGYIAGRAPNCQSSNGLLFFDDVLSLEEKVSHANSHGLGGITYWSTGKELSGFFDMVRNHYPDGGEGLTMMFNPIHDAEIDSAGGSNNTAYTAVWSGSPEHRAYLTFDTSALPSGATITGATLRLYVANGTANGPTVRKANGAFNEATISWTNQPGYGTTVYGNYSTVPEGAYYEIELGPGLVVDGLVHLALIGEGGDSMRWNSEENAANKPQLVVKYIP